MLPFTRTLRALALLLACLHGAAAAAPQALPEAVSTALAQAGLPAEALAAAALPLGHRSRPWGYRAQEPMQPASTMKLVTSIVALDRLGPNHRGSTELRSSAPLQGDTLAGDLVLRGGADPELGLPQLWALLLDLRQAGVRHIAGDLWVDRSRFRPARIDQGLPPFDEAPAFRYNGIPDALLLAENLLPLDLQATADGVQARTVPPLPGIVLSSAMRLVDRPCAQWSRGWEPAVVSPAAASPGAGSPPVARPGAQALAPVQIELRGEFPRGCTQRTALALVDRALLTEQLFRAVWYSLGGSWAGRALEQAGPEATRVLARRVSRPWGEVLRHLNKTSDNTLTRLLYLELGVPAMAQQPQASTLALADQAVRAWLAEHGIPDHGLVLDNGSGLSRSERISPWQLARMLQVAHAGRHAPDLMMSLPVAGVDGTLRNRLQGSPAQGWARLKTGTLRNVTALAGYLQDEQGRSWAVAMMINHELSRLGRPALDALVEHLVRFGPHGPGDPPWGRVGPQGEGP